MGFLGIADVWAKSRRPATGGANLSTVAASLWCRGRRKSRPLLPFLFWEGVRIFTVELYLKVRSAHFQDGLSARQIARDFGIS